MGLHVVSSHVASNEAAVACLANKISKVDIHVTLQNLERVEIVGAINASQCFVIELEREDVASDISV